MRALVAVLSIASAALVFTARAEEVPGKQAFEAGVAAAEAQRWQEACVHFEASLEQADKPATRFNLILVYDALHQPLEVVRQGLAFLAFPDQAAREPARVRARELLAGAMEQLAVLTIDAVPSSLALSVDGPAHMSQELQRIFVVPGAHHLEARRNGELLQSVDVQLSTGQILPWPDPPSASTLHVDAADSARQTSPPLASAVLPPREPLEAERPSQTRTRIAWTLGGMGLAIHLSAIGVYLGAVHRAEEFGQRDLHEPGVGQARDDALRLQNATPALALTGGTLLGAATALGLRTARHESVGWSVGALLTATAMAGAGLALVLHEPPFVPGTELTEPTQQAGYLLAASALPLFAYGVSFLVARRRARTARAALPLGAFW